MAQKLLKTKKTKIAPKKDAVKETSIVLVGTYKEKQLAWIQKNGTYNYPAKDGDELTDEACGKVKELWLYADVKSTPHAFAASFVSKMSREEFLAAYPSYAKLAGSRPSGRARTPVAPHTAYYVFKTMPLDYGPASDGSVVIARAADFGGRSAKVKKAVEQFKADGEFAPLTAYLPSDLAKVPRQQLRVCEAAVQMDFAWSAPLLVQDAADSEQATARVVPEIQDDKSNIGVKQYVDKIINGDSADVLKSLPDNSVDMVVTSPPYDQIRDYNGFTLDLHAIGMQLYRVVKEGGVVAMVIQDSTKNFAKTLTSFRTIVDWCDNIGFKMFETVIYHKNGTEGAWWKHRFRVDHEYMPIFFKGERPQYFNKEPLKIPSKWGGKVMTGSGNRRTSGETTQTVTRPINMMKCRGTVWDYMMAGDKNPLKRKHPAVFPDKIPYDFIQCFCPPNGIVLDPFVGCGSTAVTAKGLGRHYIGIDISQEYCQLAEERIRVDAVKYAQLNLNI